MILLILSYAACILWFLVKFVTIMFFAADCIVVMMLTYNFAAQNILPLVGNGTSGDVPIALACAVVGVILYVALLYFIHNSFPRIWKVVNLLLSFYSAYNTYLFALSLVGIRVSSILTDVPTPNLIAHAFVGLLLSGIVYVARDNFFKNLSHSSDDDENIVYVIEKKNDDKAPQTTEHD